VPIEEEESKDYEKFVVNLAAASEFPSVGKSVTDFA
jgi:hypothetical protein